MKENKNLKQFIVILVLLLCAGAVSWNLYFKIYRQKDTVDIHVFPKQIGDWTSEELKITEAEYAILETRNAFARRYTNSKGEQVQLLLVYSQNNRKVSHPPEVCYTGSGANILKNYVMDLSLDEPEMVISANHLVFERKNIKQVAYYWFKVGSSFTPNYWKQQLLIALKTLAGQPTSSALVRISTVVDEFDDMGERKAYKYIKNFTTAITPLVFTYLP